jgi:type II secretory pathway pseudopilin PulG
MPEELVVLIAIVGIVLVGLAFTAINLVDKAGQFIGLALLIFLGVLLLNRALPTPSYPEAYLPGDPSPSSPYPPGSYPPSASRPFTTNDPAAPNQTPSRSFNFDTALDDLSGFVQSAFNRIDEFVYGDPYVANPQPLQPDDAVSPPLAQQPQPPEQSGYQIRPDGVPSRVSTLVEPNAPAAARPAASPGGGSRPVSAWW